MIQSKQDWHLAERERKKNAFKKNDPMLAAAAAAAATGIQLSRHLIQCSKQFH